MCLYMFHSNGEKSMLKENLNSLVCCSIEGVWGRVASPLVRVFGRERAKRYPTLYIRKIWESCENV